MSSKKNVPAAAVRAWATENLATIPEAGHLSVLGKNGDGTNVRGRLHPTVIEAFRKANKGKVYEAKVAEAREVTFPVVMLNKAGRKYTKSVTITTGAARVLLGQPTSQRGRMSKAALATAYAAENA